MAHLKYHVGPGERQARQEAKIVQLEREIKNVEKQMLERAAILHQLGAMQAAEAQEHSDYLVSKYRRRSLTVENELERVYGKDTAREYTESPDLQPRAVEDVIAYRTKEHELKQQERALQIKYLSKERERLQDARERLKQKRQALERLPSPAGSNFSGSLPPSLVPSPVPSIRSVHSAKSQVHRTMADLPDAVERIYQLRQAVQREYDYKKRPYQGELGLESYEAWQLDDYVIVRKLVEDFVDKFIIRHIHPGYSQYEPKMRRVMKKADQEEYARNVGVLSERRAVQLVGEELYLEVTRQVMREVVEELLYIYRFTHNATANMCMTEAERVSTGETEGRDPEDPAYNLITKGLHTLQQKRNDKSEIWGHSQGLQLIPKDRDTEETPAAEADELTIEHDMEDISFHHITPSDLRRFTASRFDSKDDRRHKECAHRYFKKEAEYWQGMTTEIQELDLGAKCLGVAVVRPSPDHHFLAVGTEHGDVIVYDTWMEPWRPCRVIQNAAKGHDAVVDIAWTLDNARILTVNRLGSSTVWLFDGGAVVKGNLKALGLTGDAQGYFPLQLAELVALDSGNEDFTYQLGPFAEQEVMDDSYAPDKAIFFPSLTFFGTQHSIVVALENGDVLKCNLEKFSEGSRAADEEVAFAEAPCVFQPNYYDDAHGVNLIGQNIEAELFRQHQNPIIHLGFIDNMSNLVTVDSKGFFNIWIYDVPFLSGFGWYTPHRKYHLDMTKIMYSPASNVKPTVVFTDRQQGDKSLEVIAKERLKAERTLDSMQLGDPWHEMEVSQTNMMMSIYAPQGAVQESGAMFNIVLRHKNGNQLSSYLTRMYKPVKVGSTRLLAARQTPTGRELVFLILFPEYPPKGPHLTLVVFDLIALKLRDIRRDIYLSQEEHDEFESQDVVSFDVSRVFGPTGSDYAFFMVGNKLQGVSLKTGNLVLQAADPSEDLNCYVVDEKDLPLPDEARVTTVCSRGRVHVVMYSTEVTTVYVLTITDEHEYEARRLMWKNYQTWEKADVVAPEVRADPLEWLLEDEQPVAIEIGVLVLECMDRALQSKGAFFLTDREREEQELQDKLYLFEKLEDEVFRRGLLSGKPQREESAAPSSVILS